MPGRQSSPEMVGRSEELERLGRALERAASGRGGAVIVAGEAGVGKTRLLTEFVAGRCESATVLVGGCLDLAGGAPPYWAVLEALRGLAQRLDDRELVDVLGPVHPSLAALVPELARPGQGDGATEDPTAAAGGEAGVEALDRLFEVTLRVLQRACGRAPVVLIVEDLHWSDRSTRDLLTFLVANLRASSFLFVATYRSDALVPAHPLHDWLAEVVRGTGVELLELGRLTRDQTADQIRSILGGPPRGDIVQAIWERSEGNAFFAEELLAAMVAGRSDLPPTLRQVLLARIGTLSAQASQALAMVATAGSPVRHELLAAMRILSGPELLAAIRECVDHQVLLVDARGGAYRFRHNLLREAVLGQLLPAERGALHRACAHALSRDRRLAHGSAPAELALHWFAAGDHAKALPAAIEAADAAEAAYGFAEACAHLERALELWEIAPGDSNPHLRDLDAHELRMRAAEFANLAGDHSRAADLARAAAQALAAEEPAARGGLAWERLGRYLWDAGASEDALVAYARAVELVGVDRETPVGARVLGAEAGALMLAGRYSESRARAEEALEVARRTRSRREEAQALAVLGFNLAYLGDPRGVGLLHDARHLAEEESDPDGVARAYVHLATLLSEPLSRLEEAVSVAEEGLERVRELGLERFHGVALQALIVNTLFRLGRWQEGDRRLADAFARALDSPSGSPEPVGTAAIDLLLARVKLSMGRGDFAASAADLAAAKALATRAIDPRFQAPVLILEAGLALWEQRLDDAREAVAAGLAKLTASQELWFAGPLVWHGLRAEADRAEHARARRGGEEIALARSTAQELLRRLRDLIGRLDPSAATVHRAAALYLAMCEGEWSRLEGASSPQIWEEVATTWDDMGQPYPAAYARWRVAEALLAQRSRSAPAAEALRSAHAMAVALGANPLHREVEALASRAGIALDVPAGPTPPAPAPAGAPAGAELGLTRRELEVLRLVALGRTNREVAGTLFISEKTAGVHVSNILRKLDLRSRVEASAVAHRLGLLDDSPHA